jgi:hypothetical protein
MFMQERPLVRGRRKPGFQGWADHFLNHLAQRHLVPLLLLPVVMSGFCLFTVFGLPTAFRSSSTTDQILCLVFSMAGICGTAATLYFVRSITKRPASWRLFDLGRTAWLVLMVIAWGAGLGCGVLMLNAAAR